MTSQQLITFLAVAENLNYRKASEQLFITQPAVTKHVMLLEKELGFRLFIRSKRDVTLTPAGELFFSFVRRTKQEFDSVILRMKQLESHHELGIGCEMSIYSDLLAESVSDFMKLFPSISIRLEFIDISDMGNAIKNKSYDIFVTHVPGFSVGLSDIDTLKIEDKRFGILAKKGYMGVNELPASVDVFNGCDFIDPFCNPRSSEYADKYPVISLERRMNLINDMGLYPANFINMPNWQSVLGAVALGMGVTLSAFGSALEQPEDCLWVPTNRMTPLTAIWYKGNSNPARANFCKILSDKVTIYNDSSLGEIS